MLKCREVVDTVDQMLEGSINRRQRLAIQIHLLICRHCRRYICQLQALQRAMPFLYGQASDAEVSQVMEHIAQHRHHHP